MATADPTKQPSVKPVTAPPFMITPLIQEVRYIKTLFYAKYGEGKTSLAASAVDVAGMRDVLLVNAESGAMSIEEADHIKHRFDIDQIKVNSFKTVAEIQMFLKAHCDARDKKDIKRLRDLQGRLFGIPQEEWEMIKEDGEGLYRLRKYKTVIIDSLTEVDVFSMYQLLGITIDMKLDVEAMEVAQFAEFRKNNQMMQLLVRAYRDLPMNVLLVAAAKFTQDEQKIMHWAPTITGQLGGQIQGFVDIVGFLQTGKPEKPGDPIPRRLYIQPIGRFDAKSRLASYKLPYFDDPSMPKIMAAWSHKPVPE